MAEFLGKFASILAEIRTPLTLAGLSVLVLYAIYYRVLKLPVFESVGRKGTLVIVQAILHRLFWLAILAILLGGASFLTSLFLDHHPPALRSSTRLVDARIDGTLATPLIAGAMKTNAGAISKLTLTANISGSHEFDDPFTAIDFKLQNTGQGTALVWKIGVEAVSAKVNRVPVLRFSYESMGPALDFHAMNAGWGGAKCDLAIHSTQLEALFPQTALSFHGEVYTGDRMIVRLAHSRADADQIAKIRALIASREKVLAGLRMSIDRKDLTWLQQVKTPLFSDTEVLWAKEMANNIKNGEKVETFEKDNLTKPYYENAIPAAKLAVRGNCTDDDQHSFSIDESAEPTGGGLLDGHGGRLWIGVSTFQIEYFGPPMQSALPSEPSVVSVIDPEFVPSEKSYPLSRAIPPGGVERFFITLGATKSAKVSVRFKIYVDQDELKSDVFQVDLWCPADCRFPMVVPDGTEFINENGTWAFPHPSSLFELELEDSVAKHPGK